MLEILTVCEGVDDQFAHFIWGKFIAVMAIRSLEIAAHVDFGEDVVQTFFNQFRDASCELSAVEKNVLVIALEETAFEANGKRGVTREESVCVGGNPSVAHLGDDAPGFLMSEPPICKRSPVVSHSNGFEIQTVFSPASKSFSVLLRRRFLSPFS